MALKIGDRCPSFTLQNQHDQSVHMDELIGSKILVIYFYPKDDTPGCTAEACSFRDSFEEFKDLGCEVIGISSDSPEKHKEFATKHRLTFTLLADTAKKVRKEFGVPTNLFGLIPGRVTYIFDQKGSLRSIYNSQTNSEAHTAEALKTVRSIQDEN